MAFKTPTADLKPIIACVGSIDLGSVGELKKGRDGSPYYTIPLQIKAQGKGMDTKINMSFLPAFFAADFDPDQMEKQFGEKVARGAKFAYRNTFINSDGTGMLQCICGDQENFERFGAMVDALPDLEPETIYDAVVGFLHDLGPVGFGYILRQPNKKTDQVDEDGKPVYARSAYYDVDAYFRLNQGNIDKLVKRARKNVEKRTSDPSVEKFQLRFDPEEFGFEATA